MMHREIGIEDMAVSHVIEAKQDTRRAKAPKVNITDNGKVQQDQPSLHAVVNPNWILAKRLVDLSLSYLGKSSILSLGKIYIPDPSYAPPEVTVQQGAKGGYFYETGKKYGINGEHDQDTPDHPQGQNVQQTALQSLWDWYNGGSGSAIENLPDEQLDFLCTLDPEFLGEFAKRANEITDEDEKVTPEQQTGWGNAMHNFLTKEKEDRVDKEAPLTPAGQKFADTFMAQMSSAEFMDSFSTEELEELINHPEELKKAIATNPQFKNSYDINYMATTWDQTISNELRIRNIVDKIDASDPDPFDGLSKDELRAMAYDAHTIAMRVLTKQGTLSGETVNELSAEIKFKIEDKLFEAGVNPKNSEQFAKLLPILTAYASGGGSSNSVDVSNFSQDDIDFMNSNKKSLTHYTQKELKDIGLTKDAAYIAVDNFIYNSQNTFIKQLDEKMRILTGTPAYISLASFLDQNISGVPSDISSFTDDLTDEELNELLDKDALGYVLKRKFGGYTADKAAAESLFNKINLEFTIRTDPSFREELNGMKDSFDQIAARLNEDSTEDIYFKDLFSNFTFAELMTLNSKYVLKEVMKMSDLGEREDFPSLVAQALKGVRGAVFARTKDRLTSKVNIDDLMFLNESHEMKSSNADNWNEIIDLPFPERINVALGRFDEASFNDLLWTGTVEEIEALKSNRPLTMEDKNTAIDAFRQYADTDFPALTSHLSTAQLNYLLIGEGIKGLSALFEEKYPDSPEGTARDLAQTYMSLIQDEVDGKRHADSRRDRWIENHLAIRESEWASSTSQLQAILSTYGKYNPSDYNEGPIFKSEIMNSLGRQLDDELGYTKATPELMSTLINNLNTYMAAMKKDWKYSATGNGFQVQKNGSEYKEDITCFDIMDEYEKNMYDMGEPIEMKGLDEYRTLKEFQTRENTFGHSLGEQLIARYVQSWAESSSDSKPLSVAVQKLVAREFGLEDFTDRYSTATAIASANTIMEVCGDSIGSFVKLTYGHTQKILEEAGIEEVYLSRGMGFESDSDTPPAIQNLLNQDKADSNKLLGEIKERLNNFYSEGKGDMGEYFQDMDYNALKRAHAGFDGFYDDAFNTNIHNMVYAKRISLASDVVKRLNKDLDYMEKEDGATMDTQPELIKFMINDKISSLDYQSAKALMDVRNLYEGEGIAGWKIMEALDASGAPFVRALRNRITNIEEGNIHSAEKQIEGALRDMVSYETGSFLDHLGPRLKQNPDAASYIAQHGLGDSITFQGQPKEFQEQYAKAVKKAAKEAVASLYLPTQNDDGRKPVKLFHQEIPLNPISSFSTDFPTAKRFAGGSIGTTIVGKIPREKVFSCFRTGIGCANEFEVVALGGITVPFSGQVWSTYGDQPHDSLITLEKAFKEDYDADEAIDTYTPLPDNISVPNVITPMVEIEQQPWEDDLEEPMNEAKWAWISLKDANSGNVDIKEFSKALSLHALKHFVNNPNEVKKFAESVIHGMTPEAIQNVLPHVVTAWVAAFTEEYDQKLTDQAGELPF